MLVILVKIGIGLVARGWSWLRFRLVFEFLVSAVVVLLVAADDLGEEETADDDQNQA